MFRSLTRLVALLILLLSPRALAAPKPHTSRKPPRGLFWAVHGPKSTVYLLGSIHMLDRSMYPLRQAVEAGFDASSALAVEANITGSPKKMQAMQQEMLAAARYPDGDGLKKHISAKTYKAVDEKLRASGINLATLDSLRPWMVAMFLEVFAAKKAGLDANLGLDVHFLREATQTDKPVIELEGVESQIKLFSDLPEGEQEALLYSSAEDYDKFDTTIREMLDAWRRGDAEEMNKLIHEDDDDDPRLKPLMAAFLTKRNVVMADKIDAFLKAGKSVYVVVGSGHLVGPDGVAALLSKKGYSVVQK